MSTVEQQADVLREIRLLQASSGRVEQRLTDARNENRTKDGPGEEVLDFIVGRLDADPKELPTRRNDLRDSMLYGMRKPRKDQGGDPAGHSSPTAIRLPHDREVDLQHQFLAKLQYRGMDGRQARIAQAHTNTLRWIFEPPPGEKTWANFREWLESDSSLYWITGKAGSGKSTLMKFICHEAEEPGETSSCHSIPSTQTAPSPCHDILRKWSGNRPLITPSFYFWASGTPMEASKSGLYISLLHQILQVVPGIIPQIAPLVWEQICLFDVGMTEIPEDELHSMTLCAIAQAQETHSMCLFVDGLDEFSGPQEELVELVRKISFFPNVKMCVSSRPWNVFQDAFEAEPNLKLENFNYKDMKTYITKSFDGEAGFSRLLRREPEYGGRLIDSIVTKSNGVFLWVTLVVRSLLSGMQNDDRVVDFEKRLSLLPADLEGLFDTILNSWDPEYFEHAAQYFALMDAYGSGSPPALLFSFADEADTDTCVKKAIGLEPGGVSKENIDLRLEAVRRRVNSRCKGLLEVSPEFGHPQGYVFNESVHYLHRSVKDYIKGSDVHDRIRVATKAFDCHLRLCSATIAFLKTGNLQAGLLSGTKEDGYNGILKPYVDLCFGAAKAVKGENVSQMIALLDNLDEAIRSSVDDYSDLYAAVASNDFNIDVPYRFGSTLLSVAVSKHVVEYVKANSPPRALVKLRESDISGVFLRHKLRNISRLRRLAAKLFDINEAGSVSVDGMVWWPLLQNANASNPPNLAIITCLLEMGADVNFSLWPDQVTVWQQLLSNMISSCALKSFYFGPKRYWEDWLPVLKLFIDHGANVKAKTFKTAVDEAERAGSIFGAKQLERTIRCVQKEDYDAARNHFMSEIQSQKESVEAEEG